MGHRISKAAVLAACIKKQQNLIDNFDQRIEDGQADTYGQKDSPSQTDESSNSPQALMEVLSKERDFAQYEMSILRGIDPANPAALVERGAIVKTDQRTFFIGVSSEDVEVEGQKVFGMSEQAPLYALMRGLKKGDSFEFNKLRYTIEDIH